MNPQHDIKGWGVDADPENEPTYPIKKYTGDDHTRGKGPRPTLQIPPVEILKSTERPSLSAVFGTPLPPHGISGMLRRAAYKHSENMYRHWLMLLFADRIDAIGGRFSDLFHGRIFRSFSDRGLGVLARYKPGLFIRKLIVRLIFIAIIAFIIYWFITQKNT